jgi:hypothetical protein
VTLERAQQRLAHLRRARVDQDITGEVDVDRVARAEAELVDVLGDAVDRRSV